jgi:hypothetical protein
MEGDEAIYIPDSSHLHGRDSSVSSTASMCAADNLIYSGEERFVILAILKFEHQILQLHIPRLVSWEKGLYSGQAAKARSKCPLYTVPVQLQWLYTSMYSGFWDVFAVNFVSTARLEACARSF